MEDLKPCPLAIVSLNVLVVSFYFPPYQKVGGRRWAKHCKYLKRENVDFKVLAGNFAGRSPWENDVKSYASKITRIEILKEKILYHKKKLPDNIFQKIVWKSSLLFWEFKKRWLKGDFNDPSKSYVRSFYTKAKSIIQAENINTVILSVGPFAYSKIFPLLKSDFPKVKFVIDFRDYWEDVFVWLNKAQVDCEVRVQQEVINSVDLILSPNKEMQEYYSNTFNKPSFLLPHCVDTDDVISGKHNKIDNKLKLIYGGAFYDNIGESIKLIKEFTEDLSKHTEVEVDFFVSVKGYEKELEHKLINRFDFIDSIDYFTKVVECDYVILILPQNRANAMSSKFFELIAFRKPILYFGDKGSVSDFIINNKLGFHITLNNIESQVRSVLENEKSQTIPNLNYNISKHTFEYQTKELIKELNKLCHSQN